MFIGSMRQRVKNASVLGSDEVKPECRELMHRLSAPLDQRADIVLAEEHLELVATLGFDLVVLEYVEVTGSLRCRRQRALRKSPSFS